MTAIERFVIEEAAHKEKTALIDADKKNLPRMNAKIRESIVCVHSRDWRHVSFAGASQENRFW
jgi:hypothetical protein